MPTNSDPKTTQLLESIVEEFKLPGIVTAVLHEGQIVTCGAAGVRKAGDPTPITVDDKLHLGSNTKAMTATLLATLVSEEKLSWKTTIEQGLPAVANDIHEAYHSITIRELLAHTGGLPANEKQVSNGSDETIHQQRIESIQRTLKQPPPKQRGEFLYSNFGYIVSGTIAERVTGQTWEALIQERLFQPLHMDSAGFGPPSVDGKIDQPWGHRKFLKPIPVQIDNVPVLGPAGRVHCSIQDWARFIHLHLTRRERPPAILDIHTIQQLHLSEPGEDYAFGWGIKQRKWADGKVLVHSGSNTTWFAIVWLSPKKDFAVLTVTNFFGQKAAAGCDKVAAEMIKRFL